MTTPDPALLARIEQLETALKGLVGLYIANAGTEHEFISCITPAHAGDLTPQRRKMDRVWKVWDQARAALTLPPVAGTQSERCPKCRIKVDNESDHWEPIGEPSGGYWSCGHTLHSRIEELFSQFGIALEPGEDIEGWKVVSGLDEIVERAKELYTKACPPVDPLSGVYTWIPVAERLPRIGKVVFIARRYNGRRYVDQSSRSHSASWAGLDNESCVTHWAEPLRHPAELDGRAG